MRGVKHELSCGIRGPCPTLNRGSPGVRKHLVFCGRHRNRSHLSDLLTHQHSKPPFNDVVRVQTRASQQARKGAVRSDPVLGRAGENSKTTRGTCSSLPRNHTCQPSTCIDANRTDCLRPSNHERCRFQLCLYRQLPWQVLHRPQDAMVTYRCTTQQRLSGI